MASTFISFQSSTLQAFQFQPVLNGAQYNATVAWNIFGQQYYLSLQDLSGNQILYRSLSSSGPQIITTFTWLANVAYAIGEMPHNVPVGEQAAFTVSDTGSGFDGDWLGLAVDDVTLTYALPANPEQTAALTGLLSFNLNLVEGYQLGYLYYRASTMQFEYEATS